MRGMNASTTSMAQPAHPFEVPGMYSDGRNTCRLTSHVWLRLVPIYDGRQSAKCPAFMFTSDDFQKLPKWPLWKGKGEIPDDSLVVVGYTWTTYTGYSSSSPSLSSNLLFVILVGLGDGAQTSDV